MWPWLLSLFKVQGQYAIQLCLMAHLVASVTADSSCSADNGSCVVLTGGSGLLQKKGKLVHGERFDHGEEVEIEEEIFRQSMMLTGYQCEANANYVGAKYCYNCPVRGLDYEACASMCNKQSGCLLFVHKDDECYMKSDYRDVLHESTNGPTTCKKIGQCTTTDGHSCSFPLVGLNSVHLGEEDCKTECITHREEPVPVVHEEGLPDPHVHKYGKRWYVFGTKPYFYMGEHLGGDTMEKVHYHIDFGSSGIHPHTQIWGFVPYEFADGDWHAYVTLHLGDFKTVIAHVRPASGQEWTDTEPITEWVFTGLLKGDLNNDHGYYESKILQTSQDMYLCYVQNSNGHNHIFAQRLSNASTIDPNDSPRTLLSPEGYRSEDRNGAGSMQIVEGMSFHNLGGIWVMLYSVGDFAYGPNNYKLGAAYSNDLIPPRGQMYDKVVLPDPRNLWGNWGNGHTGNEIGYVLQSQRPDWPNYCGHFVRGPGLGSIVMDEGVHWLVFHGYIPESNASSAGDRFVFKAPLQINIEPGEPTTDWLKVQIPLPTCQGSESTWDAGYGGCDTYESTLNRNFCATDSSEGFAAYQVCPGCGLCVVLGATPVPPTFVPTPAPTPAPTPIPLVTSYAVTNANDCSCSEGEKIFDRSSCLAAARYLGVTFQTNWKRAGHPKGCIKRSNGLYFNKHPTGSCRSSSQPVCIVTRTQEAEDTDGRDLKPEEPQCTGCGARPMECWTTCGGRGFCSACDSLGGRRGACCKSGAIHDPEECQAVDDNQFLYTDYHMCVLTRVETPAPEPQIDVPQCTGCGGRPMECWTICGGRGFCSACDSLDGRRGACCQSGNLHDPRECQSVDDDQFLYKDYHMCVLTHASIASIAAPPKQVASMLAK